MSSCTRERASLLGHRARGYNAEYDSVAGRNHGHLVTNGTACLVDHPNENQQEHEHERKHDREHENGNSHGHGHGNGHGHGWEP